MLFGRAQAPARDKLVRVEGVDAAALRGRLLA
jgi:hypothetical protein